MRGLHSRGRDLRDAEDDGRDEEAPETRALVFGNQEIAADAREESSAERAEGKDRDVHCLALLDISFADRGVVVFPQGLYVVANVAVVGGNWLANSQ